MIRIRFIRLMCLVLAGLLAPSGLAVAEETITFAFFENPNQSQAYKWAEMTYTEAFRRLGLKFRYKVCPPKRSSMLSDSGRIDGEMGRIRSYGEEHPNLIRVEQPLFTDKVLAVVAGPEIHIDTWQSLRGSTYKVEFYRGIVIAEKNLRGIVDAGSLTTISHPVSALKKLKARRIDVYVDMAYHLKPLLQSPEFSESALHIAAVLDEVKNYPYLHKRHADLAPKLAQVLRKMKSDGIFRQYFEDAFVIGPGHDNARHDL